MTMVDPAVAQSHGEDVTRPIRKKDNYVGFPGEAPVHDAVVLMLIGQRGELRELEDPLVLKHVYFPAKGTSLCPSSAPGGC